MGLETKLEAPKTCEDIMQPGLKRDGFSWHSPNSIFPCPVGAVTAPSGLSFWESSSSGYLQCNQQRSGAALDHRMRHFYRDQSHSSRCHHHTARGGGVTVLVAQMYRGLSGSHLPLRTQMPTMEARNHGADTRARAGTMASDDGAVIAVHLCRAHLRAITTRHIQDLLHLPLYIDGEVDDGTVDELARVQVHTQGIGGWNLQVIRWLPGICGQACHACPRLGRLCLVMVGFHRAHLLTAQVCLGNQCNQWT